MTQTRGFNMPKLRRRIKKVMKTKYGKKIALSRVDQIWEQYFLYGIQKPLLRDGKVVVDDNFSIEIVGERIENHTTLGLLAKGVNVNGIMKDAVKFDNNRPGVMYKIEVRDRNYKGQLIFEANPKLKKAVSNELINTQTYYRIKR